MQTPTEKTSPPTERGPAVATPARGPSLRSAIEWVVIIAGALVVALLIKTFLLQAFFIPSESMEATLSKGDRVLVNKLSYRLHDVRRGDVVVFERPPREADPAIKDLIKRVVGLPGERVEGRDGQVLINGRRLREPYLQNGTTTADFSEQKVPSGFLWVMGDNRGNSSDSRVFGPISKSLVVGRAFIRIWPPKNIGLL